MHRISLAVALALSVVACGDDVGSEEDAQRAYLGLDGSVDLAIGLGLDGFNSASNANIAPQTGSGSASGTLTVAGTVDQGASDNKTMHLTVEMKDYSEGDELTYNTTSSLPAMEIKLSKIPTGTLDGSLNGTFVMTGDLEADVVLALTFSGQLQGTDKKVERKPGTTHITGTATSGDATYNVDVTR